LPLISFFKAYNGFPKARLLARFWFDLLEVPVCVIVNRSPIEVARSLQMRNRFPIAVGLALWECYNIAALNATRGQRQIQVNYADLMADPVGTVRQLKGDLETLGIRGLRVPSDEVREVIARLSKDFGLQSLAKRLLVEFQAC
jgi:hypothetical protein